MCVCVWVINFIGFSFLLGTICSLELGFVVVVDTPKINSLLGSFLSHPIQTVLSISFAIPNLF